MHELVKLCKGADDYIIQLLFSPIIFNKGEYEKLVQSTHLKTAETIKNKSSTDKSMFGLRTINSTQSFSKIEFFKFLSILSITF